MDEGKEKEGREINESQNQLGAAAKPFIVQRWDPSTKSCNNETMAAHVPRSCTSEYNQVKKPRVQLNDLETVCTISF